MSRTTCRHQLCGHALVHAPKREELVSSKTIWFMKSPLLCFSGFKFRRYLQLGIVHLLIGDPPQQHLNAHQEQVGGVLMWFYFLYITTTVGFLASTNMSISTVDLKPSVCLSPLDTELVDVQGRKIVSFLQVPEFCKTYRFKSFGITTLLVRSISRFYRNPTRDIQGRADVPVKGRLL